MNGKNKVVFEAIGFAARTLVEHVRILGMILLAGFGMSAVVVAFVGLINKGLIQAVMVPITSPLRAEMMGLITANFFSLLVSLLIIGFFFIGLYLGFNKVGLALRDRGNSSVKELFSCFGLVPRAFVALLVYSIIVTVGTMLFIIPGIIAFLRLSLFPYFIIDKNAGAIESLKMAYKATKNHVWQAFALCVAVAIITILLRISWVGNIAVIPFSALVYVYFYRSLVAQG
jgi:hypothetical protein